MEVLISLAILPLALWGLKVALAIVIGLFLILVNILRTTKTTSDHTDENDIITSLPQGKSLFDELNDTTVKLFRDIAEAGKTSIDELSDTQILEIINEVITAFKNASESIDDNIQGGYLLTIAMHHVLTHAVYGELFYYKHLDYEVDNYLQNGLRDSYKNNLF